MGRRRDGSYRWHPTENWTPAQHLEVVARAALTDSIAEVCDGARVGLEDAVWRQLRVFLGDPEAATLSARMKALRESDKDLQTPLGIVAQTRGPVAPRGGGGRG